MWNFFIALFLNLVVAALQPKPKIPNAKKYSLSEFEFPTATEDRSQVVGFGTFKTAGNVIWYGDYAAMPVTRKVRTGMFSSTRQIIGYRYCVGIWMTLSALPCDELVEIRYGDRVVWSGNQVLSKTGVTTVDVAAEWNTTEGQEVPDGLKGQFRFFNQAVPDGAMPDFVPITNPYMSSQLGGAGEVPAYPNTLHVVWVGPSDGGRGFVGSGPNIAPMTFVLRRRPDLSAAFPDARTITYPVAGSLSDANVRAALNTFIADNSDVEGDANPAFAQLELMTTRSAGVGPRLSSWSIVVESFLREAERLKAENHGVSFSWESTRPVSEVSADLQSQMNAHLEIHERTGQLQLRLIRETDQPVAVFDDSNIIELGELSRVTIEEAPNIIEVPFEDRSLNWQARTVHAKNPAGVRAAGALIPSQREFIGVSRANLASVLATREARILSSPLAKLPFSAFVPAGTVLKPGQVVSVQHSPLNLPLRMRVATARFANFQNRNRVELECIEDVFRSGYSTLAVTVSPPPDANTITPPTVLLSPVADRAPYALTGDDADHLLYHAVDPDNATTAYRLAIQEGVSGWSTVADVEFCEGTQEPAITATLQSALTSLAAGNSFSLTLSASALEQWKRQTRGKLWVIAGNEWMQCEAWSLTGTTLTATGVLRGIFDTVPQRHEAGATFRVLLGYTVDGRRLKTWQGSGASAIDGIETLVARAQSVGPGGTLPVESAAGSHILWQYDAATTRASRALPVADVQLSGSRGALSAADTPPNIARSGTLTLSWKNRNRLQRTVSSYYSAPSVDVEPNTRVWYSLEPQNDQGLWDSQGFSAAPIGASSLSLSLSSVPAGARLIRLRMQVWRTVGTDVIKSNEVLAYWRLTS